jgi:hypothetical protein
MAKFNLTNFFSNTLQKFGTKNNPKAAQLKSGGAAAKFGNRKTNANGLFSTNANKLFKNYLVLSEVNTVNDLAGQSGNLANWNSANISAATYSSSTVMTNAQQPKYIALGQSNQG